MTPFIIDCAYVDFDGYHFGPRAKRFVIKPYTGNIAIASLAVYPAEFHPNYADLKSHLVSRGQKFRTYAKGVHTKYVGYSLREARRRTDYYKRPENSTMHTQWLATEVMVDQASAMDHLQKKYYGWRFHFGGSIIAAATEADQRETFEPLPDKSGDTWITDVFDDSIFDADRRSDFVHFTDLMDYRHIDDKPLFEDSLLLLPPRIYGYALPNRKWLPLDVNLLTRVPETSPGGPESDLVKTRYEDPVLAPGHQELLQALVKFQIRQGEPSNQLDESHDFTMDVVRGKGKGLVILLHGAPGVGKTSTAECVAAHLKSPLLPLTCGDLGRAVEHVEENLDTYCALAQKWRCVLLLDEADVFLAKREKGDLIRNSLVSVFLRTLEYYSGVLILTTNRVGEFDEAFRSRIHISLYYPKLERRPTLRIWKNNLDHIKNSNLAIDIDEPGIKQFALNLWEENERELRRWNGRQIKNAFQTAIALANWDFHEQSHDPPLAKPILTAEHLRRVADTSALFDDYLRDTHAIELADMYSELAKREEIRKDDFTKPYVARSVQKSTAQRAKQASARGKSVADDWEDFGRNGSGGFEDRGAQAETLNLELELARLEGDEAKIKKLELLLKINELKRQKGSSAQPESTQVKHKETPNSEDDDWE